MLLANQEDEVHNGRLKVRADICNEPEECVSENRRYCDKRGQTAAACILQQVRPTPAPAPDSLAQHT